MSNERLVELIQQGDKKFSDKYEGKVMLHIDELYEFVADYLLANGVIDPTVKLGDKVWCLSGGEVCEAVVIKVEYNFYTTPNEWITVRVYSSYYGAYEDKSRIDLMLGKTVFLTREEAEKELEKRGKRMDNPCKHCNKANIDFVNDCEYGCDNPCEKAKEFYSFVGKKLDELTDKCQRLLKKEDEGENNA